MSVRKTALILIAALGLAVAACSKPEASADRLEAIKAAGVLKVATFDSNPPFGSVDP